MHSRFPSKAALLAATCFAAIGIAVAAENGPHWSYEGKTGPNHWGELSEKFSACGRGHMQSPIDLGGANAHAQIKPSFSADPVPLTITHNGHTVQIDIPAGAGMQASEKSYRLLQFHFHTPSEHLLDGKPFPMEAHFVHVDSDGRLAVIGVMFIEGEEHPGLKPVIANLPKTKTPAKTMQGVTVDPSAIVPKDTDYYRYMGSLTTPPCSEGVNWFIAADPEEASKAQIEAIAKAVGMNSRPAQRINNRLVIEP